jgi:hypothetical protein
MDFDYKKDYLYNHPQDEISSFWKKQKYIITYKDISGEKCTMDGEVVNKAEAEGTFKRNFNPLCKIIKIQTIDEWIDETSTKIVKKLMKHVKKDIGNLFDNSV